jgi:hypothetical protein
MGGDVQEIAREAQGWLDRVVDLLLSWADLVPDWLKIAILVCGVVVLLLAVLARSGFLDGYAKIVAAKHGEFMEWSGIRKPKDE